MVLAIAHPWASASSSLSSQSLSDSRCDLHATRTPRSSHSCSSPSCALAKCQESGATAHKNAHTESERVLHDRTDTADRAGPRSPELSTRPRKRARDATDRLPVQLANGERHARCFFLRLAVFFLAAATRCFTAALMSVLPPVVTPARATASRGCRWRGPSTRRTRRGRWRRPSGRRRCR